MVLSETFKRLFWAYDLGKVLEAEDVLTKMGLMDTVIEGSLQIISHLKLGLQYLRTTPIMDMLREGYALLPGPR